MGVLAAKRVSDLWLREIFGLGRKSHNLLGRHAVNVDDRRVGSRGHASPLTLSHQLGQHGDAFDLSSTSACAYTAHTRRRIWCNDQGITVSRLDADTRVFPQCGMRRWGWQIYPWICMGVWMWLRNRKSSPICGSSYDEITILCITPKR